MVENIKKSLVFLKIGTCTQTNIFWWHFKIMNKHLEKIKTVHKLFYFTHKNQKYIYNIFMK